MRFEAADVTRAYEISVGPQEIEGARSSAPFQPTDTVLRHAWSFDESDFDRIPVLRAWIASHNSIRSSTVR